MLLSLIPIDSRFLKAIEINSEVDFNIVEIKASNETSLNFDFYEDKSTDFVIFVVKEDVFFNRDKCIEDLVKCFVHPNYHFYLNSPVVILDNQISNDFEAVLANYLSSFGYNKVYVIKKSTETFEIALVDSFERRNNHLEHSNLMTCNVENITSTTMGKSNYLIINVIGVNELIEILRQKEWNLTPLIDYKLLQEKYHKLERELSWKNKQLVNHKMYLHAVKTDRSLMLFIKIETFIKKINWLRKLLKKILIRKA